MSVTDPLIGRTLDGRYELLARLGAGSAGAVYQGRHLQLDRQVAIKVLPPGVAASPEWRRRFEREARALSALAHPNLVPFTAFGIDGDVPYLVMELLQGKTLADLIHEGPVEPARALDIVRQTLRGLSAAHDQAIAHCDLKPANIFLQATPDHADHVRILDFGVAKLLEGGSVVFGTPAYMSPEQANGERVDTRTDIYAAGAILFQLLAGRPPYARLVQPVIERAMAKKPADRYPKALWMLSALESIEGGSSVAATIAEPAPTRKDVPSTPSARPPREAGSRRWLAAIAVVALAGSITAGVAFLRRHGGQPVEKPQQTTAPAAPPPAQPPPPAPAPAKPTIAAAPGKEARDPWQDPVPEALKPIRDSLEHGTRLTEGALGPAYAFARQNPSDPRPWLLIAHAYAQLNWLSDSVERYQRAYRADPTSRGDPQMLEDLLKAAAHRSAGRNAARVIRDIYGAEALPALDKAIERGASDEDGNERLDHLRDSLAE